MNRKKSIRDKIGYPPLGFTGIELDHLFSFLDIIELENFVANIFLSPFMFEICDYKKFNE